MEMNFYDKRERNKVGLEHYFLNKDNIYDIAIDKVITDLKIQIDERQQIFSGWTELMVIDPVRYQEQVAVLEGRGHSIDYQQYDTLQDISYINEQLLSLAEMKIIYAFKFLEITVKKLLQAAYELATVRSFYKWDVMTKFLTEHGIEVKQLHGHNEILELKQVNNAIKHSDEYEMSLSHIAEFKSSDILTYDKIDLFYKRVEAYPNIFLQNLIDAVYKDLYVFDDHKIKHLANSLGLRMNENDARKFSDALLKLYE